MPLPPPAILLILAVAGVALLASLPICSAHSPSCSFSDDHHHPDHDHHHHHHHHELVEDRELRKLPEELAEEEDLKLFGFDHHHHHHHHHSEDEDSDLDLPPLGVWVRAMGCSLLVSLASLICLIILPVIFWQGKPSKAAVDCLAVFGAGAMLGDAFLHQLPHAFGGEHSHSHEHLISNIHYHDHEHGHSHSHSLKDLSVGLSILSGIVLFLLVEKVVRYVEEYPGNGGHGHHHHHHNINNCHKLKDDDEDLDRLNSVDRDTLVMASEKKKLDGESIGCLDDDKHSEHDTLLRKRATSSEAATAVRQSLDVKNGSSIEPATDVRQSLDAKNDYVTKKPSSSELVPSCLPSSLVFGYLNLFSDGVHNFTDGMALGSAFLLHGSVGGWSRTLFLLAHEIPQEIGDFGILVRSGFTVSKALFFNFLSALVALVGTALALVLGKSPGHSSLIEGFTAGGFVYIAVAGVLPEMNSGKTTVKSTAIQLVSLILGMGVALCISLVE